MKNKKGQVWIETVLYTLIGLALIGIVLAVATPAINKSKDKIIVEQTIDSLNEWDKKINEVIDSGPGNKRNIASFMMKKGSLFINSPADEVNFVIDDLSAPYSEPGVLIELGKVKLISYEESGEDFVRLSLNYSSIANITYAEKDSAGQFSAASIPYSFDIENTGNQGGELFVINIEETSRG